MKDDKKRLVDADLLIKRLTEIREGYHTGNMLVDACLVGLVGAIIITVEVMAAGGDPKELANIIQGKGD